eukprot:1144517-Pelagomonas_calceolata.AAC.1
MRGLALERMQQGTVQAGRTAVAVGRTEIVTLFKTCPIRVTEFPAQGLVYKSVYAGLRQCSALLATPPLVSLVTPCNPLPLGVWILLMSPTQSQVGTRCNKYTRLLIALSYIPGSAFL